MYITSKTKRVFAIDCQEKKLVFHTEICEFREYRILKIGLFHRVKDLSKLNQTGYEVYHGYLDCKTKKNFCDSLRRKKVSFSYVNLRISRIPNFENRSFSSGQGLVQIERKSVWSIPCVYKV